MGGFLVASALARGEGVWGGGGGLGVGEIRACSQASFLVINYWRKTLYFIKTNEILGELSRDNISSHVKTTCYLHTWKDHRCYGYIINRAYLSEMVWYFIGVYIINRTLHGLLEIRNFFSRVEKRNFLSPRGHVISSIRVISYNPDCGTICDFHASWLTRIPHRLKSRYRKRSCRQASEYISVVSNLPFSYTLKGNTLLNSLLPHQQHWKGKINSDKL